MNENFRLLANAIYCEIEDINTKLMLKSNNVENNGKETFENVMDFYITSHAMSFLKNICLGLEKSIGTIFNMRCILEAKALLVCYEKGDLSDEQLGLFKLQFAVIEYRKYKDFFNMQEIISKKDLEQNYNKTVKKFEECCPKHINLNKVLKSNLPCFLQEKISFEYLIKHYLGEGELCMYKTCSQFIHPNDNNTLYKINIENYFAFIIDYIINKYVFCDKLKPNRTFIQKYNFYVGEQNSVPFKINEIVNKQVNELKKCTRVFEKFYGINYHSNTFSVLIYLLKDITADFLFGLTEQVKIKWKVILELVAIMDYLYPIGEKFEKVDNRYKLFVLHTKKQLYDNNGINEEWSQIYSIYKTMFPNGVTKEEFYKNFNSILGFLIDEKGMCDNNLSKINLINLVKYFANKFKNTDESPNQDLSKIMMLNYIEGQFLSHSNGYMYYSNSGAWEDCNSVVQIFDFAIIYNLNKILQNYNFHSKIEETNEFKTLRNCVRNVIKNYKNLMTEKFHLMSSVEKIDRIKLK